MDIVKKISTITAIIITIVLGNNYSMATGIDTSYCLNSPIRVALFAKDLNDDYLVFLRNKFEDIQKNNEEKVVFTFHNANFNESTQNVDIDKTLKESVDLILLDIVNINYLEEVISKIAQYNVPVIVFNREPPTVDAIKAYKRALLVGVDSKQAGILQGKMIVDAWNNHKESIDKNKDNILQYIMLIGEKSNETSINRSKYSISTIQQAGIKTQELASPILNWDTETARSTIDALLLRYSGKIEAIISNDDSMAIGAVEALQKYGYNTGNKLKVIPVVGVDGIPKAIELVSNGFMLGTALQDPNIADVMYNIGMNLVDGKDPVEGTSYKLDETGVSVHIPFKEYTGPMFK